MLIPDDNDIRASHAEREQAIHQLQTACGEGRLSLDEFSDRAKAVYASRTRGQLVPLTGDLPRHLVVPSGQRSATSTTVALMSEIKRRGRWRIDRETIAISVMGSCTLDLRQAVIHGNEVIIKAYVVMGAVKIIVPPGIQVDLEGFTILGSRESKIVDDRAIPGAPIIRVQGLTVMGEVKIVSDDSPAPAVISAVVERLD